MEVAHRLPDLTRGLDKARLGAVMRAYIGCFLVFLLILGSTTAGFSQQPPALAASLSELDHYLEFARAIVTPFNDPRAREALKRAFSELDKARAALTANRLQLVRVHIQAARELADLAIKFTLDGPVARLRTRLEEVIRKAEGVVIGSGNAQAERLLQRAKENQKRAGAFLQAHNFGKALEHYQLAEKLAQQAIDVVRRDRIAPSNALEVAQQQFDRLRDRAREAVERSHNAQAQKLFEEALKRGRSARQALERGQMSLAAEHYNQAIRLFSRVLEVASSGHSEADVRLEAEVQRVGELIRSARRRLESGNRLRGRILLNRAEILWREAGEALRRGEFRRAGWKLTVARNLVVRALRQSQGASRDARSQLEKELENLRKEIQDLRIRAQEQGTNEALALITMAEATAERAERFLRRGRPRLSLELIVSANRFVLGAERLLSREDMEVAAEAELRGRLAQLGEAIRAAEQRVGTGGDELSATLLEQARLARDRAGEALGKGQLAVARINIAIAFDALRRVLQSPSGP